MIPLCSTFSWDVLFCSNIYVMNVHAERKLTQTLMGFWYKKQVQQGNLSESDPLKPEKSWRETHVTRSVTSQRALSLPTICPTSEGFLNMEGPQAHWDECRRACARWSSIFQEQSAAAEQGNVWSFRKWDEGGGRGRRTGRVGAGRRAVVLWLCVAMRGSQLPDLTLFHRISIKLEILNIYRVYSTSHSTRVVFCTRQIFIKTWQWKYRYWN